LISVPCPLCGSSPSTDFVYVDEAEALDGESSTIDEWRRSLHFRANPFGPTHELWQHASGCRQVLVLTRDRVTNAIVASRLLRGRGGGW